MHLRESFVAPDHSERVRSARQRTGTRLFVRDFLVYDFMVRYRLLSALPGLADEAITAAMRGFNETGRL